VYDEFPAGLDGRNGPIIFNAGVSDRQNWIDGQADQFSIMVLGRRHQLQGARCVATVHRYLHHFI
jgi:hypothetical protein